MMRWLRQTTVGLHVPRVSNQKIAGRSEIQTSRVKDTSLGVMG